MTELSNANDCTVMCCEWRSVSLQRGTQHLGDARLYHVTARCQRPATHRYDSVLCVCIMLLLVVNVLQHTVMIRSCASVSCYCSLSTSCNTPLRFGLVRLYRVTARCQRPATHRYDSVVWYVDCSPPQHILGQPRRFFTAPSSHRPDVWWSDILNLVLNWQLLPTTHSSKTVNKRPYCLIICPIHAIYRSYLILCPADHHFPPYLHGFDLPICFQ